MRFAVSACLTIGLIGWLGLNALGQGTTVTLPTAIPPNSVPCQNCAPGAAGTVVYDPPVYGVPGTAGVPGMYSVPGTTGVPGMYGVPGTGCPTCPTCPTGTTATCTPMPSGITAWDPYGAGQNVVPMVPSQPLFGDPCAPRTIRFGVFGEYLWMRPGSTSAIDFAVPINGAIVPPPDPVIPQGAVGTLKPDFDSGIRFGGYWQMTCDAQLGVSLTHYETEDEAALAIDPAGGLVLLALVVHPAVAAANLFFTDAAATYRLKYQTIDIDYRHTMCSDCEYRVNYLLGARYLTFEEDFAAQFTNPGIVETVTTNNEFTGAGFRGGFEGEFGGQNGGLFSYGRLIGGALVGRLQWEYSQQDNFIGPVVFTSREDQRIVPTVEAELGLGWRSRNRHWRLSAGYNITALFNLATTTSLVQAVQTANFSDNEDTFTLHGLVGRAEFAF